MNELSRRELLAGAVTLPLAGRALAAPTFRYPLKPEPVGDGSWVVRGADSEIRAANGGAIANIVILATDAGPVLVDAGPSRRYGEQLAMLARELTGKSVARVYLTHFHPDHSYGSSAFDPAIVAATAAFRAIPLAQHQGFGDGMYRLLGDWMRGTEFRMPQLVAEPGPVTIGGRSLQLLALAGHSPSDLALLDTKSGLMIAGDLVFHDRAPSTPHADLVTWRRSLATLKDLQHRALVPGHGPFDPTPADAINQTRDWLDWLESTLRSAVEGGLDMVEAGEVAIPSRFAGLAAARYELQRSVSHFFPALEAAILPRVETRD